MLTNKPQELTAACCCRGWIWRGYFAAVYGAGSKPYTKPDPRIFHDVVNELLPAEAAAGGDDRRFHHRSVTPRAPPARPAS